MSSEQFELFLILLKLKSYLVSLIDHPSEGTNSLEITEEFLERKYPNMKEEILEMFSSFQIVNDAQIAFDDKIHIKFKEMLNEKVNSFHLSSILEKFNIDTFNETLQQKSLEESRISREQKLREIVGVLLQLARIWSKRSELESDVEDISFLEEEEVIRPDELVKLSELSQETYTSYKAIAQITNLYLEYLIDYYFKFGGNIVLKDFINNLDEFKKLVQKKYKILFNQSGLNII